MDDTIKIVESLEKSGLPIDGKKAFLDLAVPLAKDNLPKSGTKVTSFVLDKFERKIKWERCRKIRKRIYFVYFKWSIYDIIKIVESLKKSGLLIDNATETVKYEIKQQMK